MMFCGVRESLSFRLFGMFLRLEVSTEKSRKIVNNCRKSKMPQKGFKMNDLVRWSKNG